MTEIKVLQTLERGKGVGQPADHVVAEVQMAQVCQLTQRVRKAAKAHIARLQVF